MEGTAMGTPPAPPYATLYYAIHEEAFLTEFQGPLFYYRRFIDDIFGIWRMVDATTDSATWDSFKLRLNEFGLKWEVMDRKTSVDFMDMTITIDNNCITTTLYEKSMNLYLYIPPHSSHPPGVLLGLIYGNIFRIHNLCSNPTEKQRLIAAFFQRLVVRGYKPTQILPLFQKAAETVHKKRLVTNELDRKSVFFHLPYHPDNPNSRDIRQLWTTHLLKPKYKQTLQHLAGVERLIVAYRRPQNLGNLLSARILQTHNGPSVSSYRITNHEGASAREREFEREIEIEEESASIPFNNTLPKSKSKKKDPPTRNSTSEALKNARTIANLKPASLISTTRAKLCTTSTKSKLVQSNLILARTHLTSTTIATSDQPLMSTQCSSSTDNQSTTPPSGTDHIAPKETPTNPFLKYAYCPPKR